MIMTDTPTFDDIHVENSDGSILSPDIDDFLEGLGYEIDTPIAHGNSRGYRRAYKTDPEPSPTYYVNLHFNSERVRGYKEYACGGEVDSFKLDVENKSLESVENFKDFMDEVFGRAFSSHDNPVPV